MTAVFVRRTRWISRVAAGTLLLLGPGVALAQQPDGPEFVVNTYTTGQHRSPQVARQPDGTFIVVWDGPGPGDPAGVFAQVYDASGTPVGAELRVNTFTLMSQFRPAAAAVAAGEFVVVWSSQSQDSGTPGSFGQRVSAAGTLLGAEFRVNTYAPGYQDPPSVAGSPSGFVVTWDSEGQDGDYSGIFAQCFTAAGVRFGSEFQVNSFTTSAQYRSDVAMNAAGEFVVTWEDYQRRRTWAQRYASGCTPVGGEFQAHSGEFGQVGIDSVGNFVVAATAPDADYFGVWAQRFSDSGVALGAEFLVNSYVTGSQESQDVAMAPNGDFVVVWQTYNYLTSEFDELSARAFRADGTPVAPEVTVNSSTAGPQTSPSVGIAGDGRFVVAWRTSLDGTDYDIAARRFRSPDVIFADGFE